MRPERRLNGAGSLAGIKTFVTLVNALIPFPSMALRALPYIEKGMWAQEGFVAIT